MNLWPQEAAVECSAKRSWDSHWLLVEVVRKLRTPVTSGGTCGTVGEGMDEGEVPGSNCFITGITGLTGSSAPKESVFYQIVLFEKEAMKTRNCDDPPRRPATKLTSVRLSLILCLRRAKTSFEPKSWTNLGQIGNSKFVHKCWKRVS